MSHIRLFEKATHAESYLKFRPAYPAGLMQKIMSFLQVKRPPPHQLAIDVGCGSGQSTSGLADHFDHVIGVDVSEAQIEAAAKANTVKNIEYRVGSDTSIPGDDDSADLVSCGQAVHWFNFEAFCKEANRVLKPSGCLAVYGYGVPWLHHKDPNMVKQLDYHFNELYNEKLGPYWNDRRKHVENSYANFSIPYEETERDDSLEMRMHWSMSHWMGYLQSWSSYQKYVEEDPTRTVVLEDYKQKVLDILGTPDASLDDTMVEVVMSIFVLLGRKPSK